MSRTDDNGKYEKELGHNDHHRPTGEVSRTFYEFLITGRSVETVRTDDYRSSAVLFFARVA